MSGRGRRGRARGRRGRGGRGRAGAARKVFETERGLEVQAGPVKTVGEGPEGSQTDIRNPDASIGEKAPEGNGGEGEEEAAKSNSQLKQPVKSKVAWTYRTQPGLVVFRLPKKLFNFKLFLTEVEIGWARRIMIERPTDGDDEDFAFDIKTGHERLGGHIGFCFRNKVEWNLGDDNTNGFVAQLSSKAQIEVFAEHFDLHPLLGCDNKISGKVAFTGGEVLSLLFSRTRHISCLTKQIMVGVNILVAAIVFEHVPGRLISPSIVQSALKRARETGPRGRGTAFGTFGMGSLEDDIALTEGTDDYAIQHQRMDHSGGFWSDIQIKPAVLLNITITVREEIISPRIQRLCPNLTEYLCRMGLGCSIQRVRRPRKFWICQAIAKCPGTSFKSWTRIGKDETPDTAVKNLGSQLYKAVHHHYVMVHFV